MLGEPGAEVPPFEIFLIFAYAAALLFILILVFSVRPGAGFPSPRPLSPYLGVYRFQLNSVMSFLHRATGVFLYVGLTAFLWSYTCSVLLPEFYLFISPSSSSWHFLSMLFRFLWIASFMYHFLNGIRHLLWDIGLGFSVTARFVSALVVFGGVFISVAALLFM